ncbi:hypothetical protein KVR01_007511 [Diaporthe batatas]|uniref:uncharacterized protein n=1 Tax=Diaporthe batatas TaxID=748121 RepID=UPI001D0543B4|nr:uncharacterized protein KVR01_007511 [Diaporthe batatas]KAG8163033.1 hypothetical protein KVR01_007511 [Diaporthe batatas]
MEMYGYLPGQKHAGSLNQLPPPLRRQPQKQVRDMDLVHYFQHFAHLSLVTFGQRPSQIRDILLSMAMTQDTVSGLACLYAVLAFSSLHRYGINEQALQLKVQAIQSLSASVAGEPLTSEQATQHVAASMILGAFEILNPLEASGEWLVHTWGAMDVIQTTGLRDQPCGSNAGHLLDWVQYHETISRFTMHHWRHKSLVPTTTARIGHRTQDIQHLPLTQYRPNMPSVNPTFAILNLLSEISETLIDPRDPRSTTGEYQAHLKDMDRRIKEIPANSAQTSTDPDSKFAVELYQMATQIYLARASQSPWEPAADLDSLIDSAFSGPVQYCSCEHFFPLLILACEAQKDEQRVAIINLIERTQRDTRIRSIQGVKDTIQSIWVQQDLHRDDDVVVDYLDIMSAVISSCRSVPSLA